MKIKNLNVFLTLATGVLTLCTFASSATFANADTSEQICNDLHLNLTEAFMNNNIQQRKSREYYEKHEKGSIILDIMDDSLAFSQLEMSNYAKELLVDQSGISQTFIFDGQEYLLNVVTAKSANSTREGTVILTGIFQLDADEVKPIFAKIEDFENKKFFIKCFLKEKTTGQSIDRL